MKKTFLITSGIILIVVLAFFDIKRYTKSFSSQSSVEYNKGLY